MVYLLNTNVNENKTVIIALTEIYGIGKALALKICIIVGFSENVKFSRLDSNQIEKISKLINENFYFGNELKQVLQKQRKRLIKISSYRGLRFKQNLPARGQRTHTNAKTAGIISMKQKI